jgi:hypothetical protein
LRYGDVKTLVDAVVHSEHGKVIKCDIKPGSVKRSMNVYIFLYLRLRLKRTSILKHCGNKSTPLFQLVRFSVIKKHESL